MQVRQPRFRAAACAPVQAPALAQVDLAETTRWGLYTPGTMKVRDPEE